MSTGAGEVSVFVTCRQIAIQAVPNTSSALAISIVDCYLMFYYAEISQRSVKCISTCRSTKRSRYF